ncbi:MAG: 6-carboxytetrahydropterin synthase [Gammaproteobacteria bacterium]|nr:6-carboxytetrahydropterin synthase [Gammaproteobacteria bacterium]
MEQQLIYTASANFESARYLPGYEPGHKLRRKHGHTFTARVRTKNPGESSTRASDPIEILEHQLKDCIAEIDYDLLNEHIQNPTDTEIARWIQRKINLPQNELIGISSTVHQGSDLESAGNTHIWRRYRFEAAHRLPNVPEGHQCGRMHGHGFEVILHADIPSHEWNNFDYATLDDHWRPLQNQLNYSCLNNIPGLENPTSEAICGWLWQRLKPSLPYLSWVTVYETVTAGCHYDGQHYRIWKEQRFESALTLPHLPNNHPHGGLHGHSYLIRLHLTAALDPVMCWTLDYGDVKEIFKPIYQQLDHHLLNDLPGLRSTDAGTLTRWIKSQVVEAMPQLDRIDLYQKPGCGVILNWGEHEPALPS